MGRLPAAGGWRRRRPRAGPSPGWEANPRSVTSRTQRSRYDPRVPDVVDLANVDLSTLQTRAGFAASAGEASVAYIERAVELCAGGPGWRHHHRADQQGRAKARRHPPTSGTPSFWPTLLGEERVTTMLATDGLRVVHVTRHVPLAEVAARITRDTCWTPPAHPRPGCARWASPAPRIAVAALNPHGGDNGLMGNEELVAIGPAVEAAAPRASMPPGPSPPTRSFSAPSAASLTWSSPCTTTRDTSPSRPTALSAA